MHTYDIQRAYDSIHASYPGYRKLPVIGVTANFSDGNCSLADGYCTSILRAGGLPLIIPPYDDTDALLSTLEHLDGLLLTGGGDINPLYNPYVRRRRDGTFHVEPSTGHKYAFRRDSRRDIPCKIDRRDLAYRLFTAAGFRWGGAWRSVKDYQHFEK